VSVRIRRYSESDLAATADVYAEAFTRQLDSKAWITCNARAYPRMRLYVAEFQGGVRFVLWVEKSGFRQDVYRKRRIGERLVVQSLPEVAKQLAARSATIIARP
jgi:hypothetical protein